MAENAAVGPTPGPTIARLLESYRSGATTPAHVVAQVLADIQHSGDDGVWITVAPECELLDWAAHLGPYTSALPLYGIPFAVKDSIDVAGMPTTLACPGYAYLAQETAPVVQALLDAGAICIGKTNLDQFATGLNGTRTPYTVPRSVFGGDLISGGSSSGSALAVALGQVPFAVATDTAGSGRVPPALNGVLGFKPSRGLISTVGLVPACRSLDCVSLIAGTVDDLGAVFDVVAAPDERDPWTRTRRLDATPAAQARVGWPDAELEFFGDQQMAQAHQRARAIAVRALPRKVDVPLAPFLAAGALLYQGPWVAERLAEFGDFLAAQPDAALPVVAQIIAGGDRFTAVDVFRAQYRLAELKAEVDRLFQEMDVLLLPTIGTTFTVAEVLEEPIATNTTLGHYTHFGNLLDLCAVAVPAGLTADGRPCSLMVLGPALSDDLVLSVAALLSESFAASPALLPAESTS